MFWLNQQTLFKSSMFNIHNYCLRLYLGSVKNYLFFIVLKSFKTLIYRRFANKKSIDLPFLV